MKVLLRGIAVACLCLFAERALFAQNPAGDGKLRIFVADRDGSNVKLLVEIPDAA